MAARFWRYVLAAELAVAAALAAILFATGALSAGVATLAFPALVLGVLGLSVALSFLVSRATVHRDRRPSRPDRTTRWRFRALCSESLHWPLAAFAMCVRTADATREVGGPGGDRGCRPLLLIHGWLCNGRVWRSASLRFRAAGFHPIRTIDLEPLSADIESHVDRVGEALLLLQRDCGGQPVAIVAHSMGGLVARAVLRALGPQAIRQIVTVASPHHGTAPACLCRRPPLPQLCPDSPWLQRLNSDQEDRFAIPVTSIYSLEDNLIAPPVSSVLQGASLQALRGVGHFGLLRERQSVDCILAALARG